MTARKTAVLAIVFAFVETIYALDATIPDVKIQTEDNTFT